MSLFSGIRGMRSCKVAFFGGVEDFYILLEVFDRRRRIWLSKQHHHLEGFGDEDEKRGRVMVMRR